MGMLESILSALGLRRKAPDADNGSGDSGGVRDSASSGDEGMGPFDDEDEHDPELEAQDDPGSFDFARDIARYFTAEFRVETVWDDTHRRRKLFSEYDVRDVKHWHQIKATFGRWLETAEAKAIYRTPGDLMQARMTTTQTMTLADLNLNLEADPAADSKSSGKGSAKPCFDPIGGVSLERWAKAEAALGGGADLEAIIGELGIDEPTWATVAKEWNARMSSDPSAKIATEYSKHVGSAAVGKLAATARGVGSAERDEQSS